MTSMTTTAETFALILRREKKFIALIPPNSNKDSYVRNLHRNPIQVMQT